MLALHATLLSVPRTPGEGPGATGTLNLDSEAVAGQNSHANKYEAAGEGLRNWLVHDNELVKDDNLELHELFREHRRTRLAESTDALALRKQTTSKPGCAASCEGLIQENGVFKSYLFYDDDSRAGLNDRAWGIAHVMALANSLCARPAVKNPSEVLSLPHNGDKSIPKQWWWTRYFSGVESLVPYDHHGNQGHSTCPPKGANTTEHRLNRLVDGKQTVVVGPSAGEADVARDLAQAAASTKPFSWCLGYNIRSYLGAGGFAVKGKPDVPHDWCTMPEAWLGGSGDETPRKGEMALGPSLLVEDLALRVTAKLGLAHWDLPEMPKQDDTPWKWPWDPQDEEHASNGFAPGGPKVMLADSITDWGKKEHTTKPKPLSPAVAAATKVIKDAADVVAKITKDQTQRVAAGTACHLQCKEAERKALKDARQKGQAAQKEIQRIQKEEEVAQKHAEKIEQNGEKKRERETEKQDKEAARAVLQKEKEARQQVKKEKEVLRDSAKKVAVDKAKAAVQGAEARRDPKAHSNVRSRVEAEEKGKCTANHGEDKPCCGQDELDPRKTDKDVRPCPSRAPVCFDYKYGKHTGSCMVQSEMTNAQMKKTDFAKTEEEKKPKTDPNQKLARAQASKQANNKFDWPWEEEPWGPTEEEQKVHDEEERKNNYKHLNEATDGRCTADHGQTKPCCGQIDSRDVPDVRPCPKSEATCSGYKLGHAMGKCEKSHVGKDQEKWLYVLHVKRSASDAKPGSYCNNNPVKAVKDYMSCPAAGGTKAANHTLLVFTDDSNKGYVNGLLTGLGKLPRWGGGVVHGDQMVRELLDGPDRADNYLVYSVASLLMSRADEFFAMERCSGAQFSTDCADVRPVSIVRD